MARICVVGGGIIGASIVARLSVEHRIVWCEQGRQWGAEATSQNAGMQRRLGLDPIEQALAIRAGELLADQRYAPFVRRVGGILLLDRPDRFDDAAERLVAAGVEVRDVTGDLPTPLSSGMHHQRAWWVDEALLDGCGLTQHWVDEARRADVDRRLRSRVTLESAGGQLHVSVDGERLDVDLTVVASGAWSREVAETLGLNRPLRPMERHLLLSHPHPRSTPDHPWMWWEDEAMYLRPEGSGWLGSPCDETLRIPGAATSMGPVDPVQAATWMDQVERRAPQLADLQVRGGWTGLRTFTPDRRPLLGGDPSCPGLFWATGFGGYGVTTAAAVGEWVADVLAGRPVRIGPEEMAPDRFESSRPQRVPASRG